jgi:hypothetical protein
MRVTILVAAAVVATAAQASSGAPVTSCTVVHDAAADVTTADASHEAVPDTHVDVRDVTFRASGSRLLVDVAVTQLVEQRRGSWQVVFTGGRHRLAVTADLGIWVNAGNGSSGRTFRAGVVGQRATEVDGTFDYATGRITITVPFAVLGIKRGTPLSHFSVEARETFVNLAPSPAPATEAGVVDVATSSRTYAVGSAC